MCRQRQEVKHIDAGVVALVGPNPDVGLEDDVPEILLEVGNKVILDASVVGVWDVDDGEEGEALPDIPAP